MLLRFKEVEINANLLLLDGLEETTNVVLIVKIAVKHRLIHYNRRQSHYQFI